MAAEGRPRRALVARRGRFISSIRLFCGSGARKRIDGKLGDAELPAEGSKEDAPAVNGQSKLAQERPNNGATTARLGREDQTGRLRCLAHCICEKATI